MHTLTPSISICVNPYKRNLSVIFMFVHVYVRWYHVKHFSFIQEKNLYSINVRRNGQYYQGGWLIHGIELLTYWTTFLFPHTFVNVVHTLHHVVEVCEPEFAEIMNKTQKLFEKLRQFYFIFISIFISVIQFYFKWKLKKRKRNYICFDILLHQHVSWCWAIQQLA